MLRRAHLIALGTAACFFVVVAQAGAATIDVTRFDDPGSNGCPSDCSLRAAVAYAGSLSGDDIVRLQPGTYTLALGEVLVSAQNVTIKGAGARATTVTAVPGARMFSIVGGASGDFESLALSGARASGVSDGAAIANGGSSSINFVALVDNRETPAGAADGGAVSNSGTMTINASTLSANQVISTTNEARGGAIINYGTLEIYDSTIAGNLAQSPVAQARGGGIYGVNGTTRMFNVTLAGNTSQGVNPLTRTAATSRRTAVPDSCRS